MHTEKIKPPRALWVPFDLGRPFGVPNDPEFQTGVITAALKLLEEKSGPVLVDYPVDAPEGAPDMEGWACPVDLSVQEDELEGAEKLVSDFTREFNKLRTWHDRSIKNRGRTTTGTSGVAIDDLPEFIGAFMGEELPANPRDDVALGFTLKYAAEDLKAYYFESVTAQPGQAPDANTLADWFWGDTAGGKMLLAIKDKCAASDDGMLRVVGNMLIVPGDQMRRKA